jgi:hypothetical protein
MESTPFHDSLNSPHRVNPAFLFGSDLPDGSPQALLIG